MTTPVPRRVAVTVIVLAFLAILLDGFDAATLAFVVPALSAGWKVPAAAFTAPLVLTNIGVVAGYMASGGLAARIGPRQLLVGGVVTFGIGSMLSALVLPTHSIALLSLTRVLVGLGLGAVLPVAVTFATRFAPERHRTPVSVAVTLGLASGSSIAGLFGRTLLTALGPAGVFWLAGGLPLVLAVVMILLLPRQLPELETAAEPSAEKAGGVGVRGLFRPGLGQQTVILWAFAFLVFFTSYVLLSWTPTLLTSYGFSPTEAPIGLAYVSIGGVLGGLLLVPLSSAIGIMRSLVLTALVGMVCLLAAGVGAPGRIGLLLLLGGAGAGVVASQIGQLTAAVNLYPAATRTTGVGWAAALGRVGSILGPAIAGLLLALKLSPNNIILVCAVPTLIAAICAGVLAALEHRARQGAATEPADTVGA